MCMKDGVTLLANQEACCRLYSLRNSDNSEVDSGSVLFNTAGPKRLQMRKICIDNKDSTPPHTHTHT